jgi:hypothetical protein
VNNFWTTGRGCLWLHGRRSEQSVLSA